MGFTLSNSQEQKKRFMIVEKFASAVFANSYDKYVSSSGKRDHQKFSAPIKETLMKKRTEEEIQARVQAEAKAAPTRRTWGF